MTNDKSGFSEIIKSKKLLENLKENNIKKPTIVQNKSIPKIKDNDAIIVSKTGSGKTLIYLQQILTNLEEKNKTLQALVLLPTNQLSNQVYNEFLKFSKNFDIKILELSSAKSIKSQEKEIQNTQIIIGTTGRVMDHLEKENLQTENLKILIIDEADQLLHSIFLEQTDKIIRKCPKNMQTLMFSATINKQVLKYSQKYTRPNRLKIIAEKYVDEQKLKQINYEVEDNKKLSLLYHIIKYHEYGLMIIFTNRQDKAEFIYKNLKKQLKKDKIKLNLAVNHKGISQNKRLKIIEDFKQEKFDILITTDILSRGIDINNISHIINYNIPMHEEKYIHRIGRTARIGKEGTVINFISKKDNRNFEKIQKTYNISSITKNLPEIEEIQIEENEK